MKLEINCSALSYKERLQRSQEHRFSKTHVEYFNTMSHFLVPIARKKYGHMQNTHGQHTVRQL